MWHQKGQLKKKCFFKSWIFQGRQRSSASVHQSNEQRYTTATTEDSHFQGSETQADHSEEKDGALRAGLDDWPAPTLGPSSHLSHLLAFSSQNMEAGPSDAG